MSIDYSTLCNQVTQLTRKVGKEILKEKQSFSLDQVEIKGLHNYVTHLDKLSERLLVEGLEKLLPEAGFIAEEGTSDKKGKDFNWIIDPIDGTTNFIHGIPSFGISIALMHQKEIVIGVVYEPNADEMFYAFKGSDAYLNEQIIHVSQQKEPHLSLIATGFPYHDYEKIDNYLGLLGHFMKTTSGIRRLGSASIDLVYVACGRFEGFYEYGLNPWDVAGGAFIVERAGGVVTDWKNGKDFIFGKEIIAANPNMHGPYLEGIQHFFKIS